MKLMLIWTNRPLNFNQLAFNVHSSFFGYILLDIIANTLTFPKRCPTPTNLRDCARLQAHKEACCLNGPIYWTVPWILLSHPIMHNGFQSNFLYLTDQDIHGITGPWGMGSHDSAYLTLESSQISIWLTVINPHPDNTNLMQLANDFVQPPDAIATPDKTVTVDVTSF